MRTLVLVGLLALLVVGAAPLAAGEHDLRPIYNCGSPLDGSYPACCPPGYIAPVTCRPREIV